MKLAIDLGGTNIRVARVAGGQIVDRKAAACPAQASEKEVLDALEALVGSLMTDEVEGIGVGVPSVVDAERGIVYNVANIPSWKEVHLKDLWQSRFGVPVAVNNDANCFALGEYSFGKGKGYRNMLGITLGTGVGAGVIIDGKLYNGMDTGAGEIGSIPYLELDYEQYCSSSFFVRCYGTTGKEAALKAATAARRRCRYGGSLACMWASSSKWCSLPMPPMP